MIKKLSILVVIYSVVFGIQNSHAARIDDLCAQITANVSSTKGLECMNLAKGGSFDDGAVDLCIQMTSNVSSTRGLECVAAVKNKKFSSAALATCVQMTSNVSSTRGLECLKAAGTDIAETPSGSRSEAGCDAAAIEGRINAAIRKLERGDQAKALELLRAIQRDLLD